MNTRVFSSDAHTINHTDIAQAATIIRGGGLVAMPTETVYGLAGNALDVTAVQAIFRAKGRPSTDPLIVHIADMAQLALVTTASDLPMLRLLAEAFWPGPLTMLVPKQHTISDAVTAGKSTVAVRMPAHAVAQALIQHSGCPLVAPSANTFSRPSPTTAAHVLSDLDGRIDAVIDAGPTPIGIESTIIDITVTPPRILRHGGITVEQIMAVVGDVEIAHHELTPHTVAPAPGMLLKHYSPRTPLRLYRGAPTAIQQAISTYCAQHPEVHVVWMGYDDDVDVARQLGIEWRSLGARTDGDTVAHRLFDTLRALDAMQADVIVASQPDGTGIAAGVCDRLYRAAEGRIHDVP